MKKKFGIFTKVTQRGRGHKTMFNLILFTFLIFFLMMITQNQTFAQSKVGTTIGQFLKISPSSRASSLADASTSLYGEVSAAFYNPASLGRLRGLNVQFTHNQWLADIDYNYAIAAMHIEEFGTLSLQAISLNSGEIDVRTVEQPLGTGERYTVTNFALGLGYGLQLTDRVSVGFVVNYLTETIWNSNFSTFAISMGVLYEVAPNSLQLGASVSNFGPQAGFEGRDLFIDYDFRPDVFGDNDQLPAELRTDQFSLPTLFRVGVSYPVVINDENRVLVTVDAIHPNDNNESINAGVEFQLLKYFNIRGGYRDLFLDDSEGGLVLGTGINMDFIGSYKITFDYAWADYGILEQVHRFTLGINF
jgi:hypothetical protein